MRTVTRDGGFPLEWGTTRRGWLLATLGTLLMRPGWAAAERPATLLSAWQDGAEQHVGLLSVDGTRWSVQTSLQVPTRAHGLWAERSGSVLAVARRPGDWLLRWRPADGTAQWQWIEGDRRFNGHVITSSDGATVWTTETDLDTAQGRLGVRHAASLEKTAEWSTHGLDPHQLLALPQPVAGFPAGTLMVANGGIPTLPETGRIKRRLERMDASLVALDPVRGSCLGQWRLNDPFLSIRHLAFDPVAGRLGVALQAEHPDGTARVVAPVLAIWDGTGLRTADRQPALAGYGGDICALPGTAEGGFAVSCPRADTLALFDAQGGWRTGLAHAEACALAADAHRWWSGSGRSAADLLYGSDPGTRDMVHVPCAEGLRLQMDNHWLLRNG